jgi:hypothetical protein
MSRLMSAHEHKPDSRLKQAEKIATHPEQYKVCEGCGSIVVTRAVTCPSCHAYMFDNTPVRVIAQAKELALRAANSVLASDLS